MRPSKSVGCEMQNEGFCGDGGWTGCLPEPERMWSGLRASTAHARRGLSFARAAVCIGRGVEPGPERWHSGVDSEPDRGQPGMEPKPGGRAADAAVWPEMAAQHHNSR